MNSALYRSATNLPIWKRCMDIGIAVIALTTLAPVIILVILAIKCESRGPVFYVSKRVGAGFKVFDFYKFRSMFVDADKRLDVLQKNNQYQSVTHQLQTKPSKVHLIGDDGFLDEALHKEQQKIEEGSTFFKVKRDPRITRVGMFLRNTSIDEIPQLVNVLKGDMSIVGNRPLPLYEAEKLTKDSMIGRFLGPAGLTGLWQTQSRGGSEVTEEERKDLDLEYAMKFNFWMDIRILLRTPSSMLQRESV